MLFSKSPTEVGELLRCDPSTLTFSNCPQMESLYMDWLFHHQRTNISICLFVMAVVRLIEAVMASTVSRHEAKPLTALTMLLSGLIILIVGVTIYLADRISPRHHARLSLSAISIGYLSLWLFSFCYYVQDNLSGYDGISFFYNSILLTIPVPSIVRLRSYYLKAVQISAALLVITAVASFPSNSWGARLVCAAVALLSLLLSFVASRSFERQERNEFAAMMRLSDSAARSERLIARCAQSPPPSGPTPAVLSPLVPPPTLPPGRRRRFAPRPLRCLVRRNLCPPHPPPLEDFEFGASDSVAVLAVASDVVAASEFLLSFTRYVERIHTSVNVPPPSLPPHH
jgi:hypothetical protein